MRRDNILLSLFILSLLGCNIYVRATECVSIYDVWTKKVIYFKVVSQDNSGVLVHRIMNKKQSKQIEFFSLDDFSIWQPVSCERIVK